jgi:hypothetical protein
MTCRILGTTITVALKILKTHELSDTVTDVLSEEKGREQERPCSTRSCLLLGAVFLYVVMDERPFHTCNVDIKVLNSGLHLFRNSV